MSSPLLTPLSPSPSPPSDIETLPVRRGRVESIDVYEVKEGELERIESEIKDTPLHLSYSTTLLSFALTCIGTLVTADFKWEIARLICVVIAVVGIVLGTYFLFRWKKTKKAGIDVIDTIRNRIKNGRNNS